MFQISLLVIVLELVQLVILLHLGLYKKLELLDGGFDYLNTPTLKIEGGNGQGAFGTVNMKLIDHAPKFFADEASAKVSLTNDTIGFSTFHKFRNAEQVHI